MEENCNDKPENCYEKPGNSEAFFKDIEDIEVKEELLDMDECKFHIQDSKTRGDNLTNSESIKVKEETGKNPKNSESSPYTKKEKMCKKSPRTSKHLPDHSVSKSQPYRNHQSLQRNDTRSFLKAHRPRLGYCGRYHAFGLYVAKKLENLPDNMGIYAQKMISDVLFEAEMGTLSRSSKIAVSELS